MAPKHIVFLIYDKMEFLDFSGPFDVFSMAILTQLRTGSRRAI
jgi:putative intracellular protease/amidase